MKKLWKKHKDRTAPRIQTRRTKQNKKRKENVWREREREKRVLSKESRTRDINPFNMNVAYREKNTQASTILLAKPAPISGNKTELETKKKVN